MRRKSNKDNLIHNKYLVDFGLKSDFIISAIDYVYDVLDKIDLTLTGAGSPKLSELLELANLSAIIGNLFRGGVINASNGLFKANAPTHIS